MDPHLLTTFVTVARHGSFSAAAGELGYTQSAISQQIAALEADLGLPLLRRRPVEPTPAGRRLLEHAEPLLLRLRAARADVLRTAAEPRHLLRLAATPLAVNPVVAARLAEARARQPRLEVRLRTCRTEQLAALVAEGRADLGLADGIAAPSDPLRLPESGPMTTTGVSEEDLVVVLPPGHPLAGRAALRLADLIDARWLRTPLCPPARLRDLVGDGFPAGLEYEGDDVHTVLALAAAGHGLTLLPASAVPAGCGVLAVPVGAPRLVHRVELLHAALPPGAAADLAAALTG
ncbi:LysR family transcriptional regulator [Nonomuraea gerenzanensis]|uniref:Chromosome initiation inhibitor n=1 Tax=Nonomuraea gerenzanensis TaxID=93944 RepID=A0A1M4ECQ4_9ACTN|nr:LysR family transcriptional regulator [Nonomuraea gerenzanensis]UBU18683.1 LysR family transcriptional regulator [Nonomuraea gerenzanensis]SBO96542.1 Chromosome initiation inhibitor [Nonomuraea gerenzanensis]